MPYVNYIAVIIFGKMHFLLISENEFTHEIECNGMTSFVDFMWWWCSIDGLHWWSIQGLRWKECPVERDMPSSSPFPSWCSCHIELTGPDQQFTALTAVHTTQWQMSFRLLIANVKYGTRWLFIALHSEPFIIGMTCSQVDCRMWSSSSCYSNVPCRDMILWLLSFWRQALLPKTIQFWHDLLSYHCLFFITWCLTCMH